MGENIKLSEFDIVGLIKLRDVRGIEKYVTPIYNDEDQNNGVEYLSRSKEYYNVKSLTELSNERESLKQLLTREKTKRNFVILENMLNCSAKVYFKKLEDYIANPNTINKSYLEICRACLLEDTENIIKMLSGKGLITVSKKLILPGGNENCAKRTIEMDNKALLYLFCKNIKFDEPKDKIQIATPGYGSIYIGPFLNCMYGYDFTNILKSKYINEVMGIARSNDIAKSVSNNEIFNPEKKVVVLDDNIGTGTTMAEIQAQLEEKGISVYKSGAVQYNWRNYYKVTVGEKTHIDRFNTDSFDIITPLNYAGHKLYSHAVDILHESGLEYERYLQSKNYRLDVCSDLIGAVKRGLIASKKSGLIISKKHGEPMVSGEEDYSRDMTFEYLPQSKMDFIDAIIEEIKNLDKEKENKNEKNK